MAGKRIFYQIWLILVELTSLYTMVYMTFCATKRNSNDLCEVFNEKRFHSALFIGTGDDYAAVLVVGGHGGNWNPIVRTKQEKIKATRISYGRGRTVHLTKQ